VTKTNLTFPKKSQITF